jgi:hypothetical protein
MTVATTVNSILSQPGVNGMIRQHSQCAWNGKPNSCHIVTQGCSEEKIIPNQWQKPNHLCQEFPEVSVKSRNSIESQVLTVMDKNGNFPEVDIC